jgi:Arc/MetJ-type ribon-helix-helix transcriptional regulator
MGPTEKITVRLSQDTMIVLQSLVERGDYDSLSEGVSDAINKMIESKLAPKEIDRIVKEHSREKPIKMESLLSEGRPESMEEAIKKAVSDYVRTNMRPEE